MFPEWTPGDPIDKTTPDGQYPAWSGPGGPADRANTIQGRYWMTRAALARPGEFSSNNVNRMQRGLAPQVTATVRIDRTGEIKEMEVSKELHHANRNRGIPGFDSPENLREVWPWQHEAIDPHRNTGYTVISIGSE